MKKGKVVLAAWRTNQAVEAAVTVTFLTAIGSVQDFFFFLATVSRLIPFPPHDRGYCVCMAPDVFTRFTPITFSRRRRWQLPADFLASSLFLLEGGGLEIFFNWREVPSYHAPPQSSQLGSSLTRGGLLCSWREVPSYQPP